MSFLKRNNKWIQSALSLQTHFKTHKKLIFPKVNNKNKPSNYFLKRISSVIPIPSKIRRRSISSDALATQEGSLTIEAALVIPIFLFAIMAILSFTEILRVQMRLDSAMQQCAKELAVYGYAKDGILGEDTGDLSVPIETLFSEAYVRNRVISEVGEEYLQNSPTNGTASLHFLGSRIMENDRIELRCTYYVTPFFSLSPKAGFLTGTTAVARAFTGYDNLSAAEQGETEEYVYVTPNGTAYHKSRNCHYLDLSIQKVFTEDLPNLRNAEGSIYQPCPLCKGTNAGSVLFITDYGNRYHTDILCSGLRRTVSMIPISEVGSRTPCKKCVY
jgi:hypothetical protein